MAASGRPIELSFTPGVAGVVRVKCRFTMDWFGSSGSGATAKVFCEQSATTTYGPAGTTHYRTTQVLEASHDFAVTSGSLVKVGLWGGVTGAASVNFNDIDCEAQFFPS